MYNLDEGMTEKVCYSIVKCTYQVRSIFSIFVRKVLTRLQKQLIIVFGMSRSGTSMLATFLAINTSSIYLHEPDVDLLKHRFGRYWHSSPVEFWNFANSKNQKEFRVHALNTVILLAALTSKKYVKTICVKPISMLDDMPEVSASLPNASILYICRHPAGRSESILRQVKHDQGIDSLADQKFEELGQDWGRTSRKILGWFGRHPDWQWIFFEHLTCDPLSEFEKLYRRFGLTWNEQVYDTIRQKTTEKEGEFYEVQRIASHQADKWRSALTTEQIEAVRRGCLLYETHLYEGF
jgi:hypothetical protein